MCINILFVVPGRTLLYGLVLHDTDQEDALIVGDEWICAFEFVMAWEASSRTLKSYSNNSLCSFRLLISIYGFDLKRIFQGLSGPQYSFNAPFLGSYAKYIMQPAEPLVHSAPHPRNPSASE
jgi:hypothetical protein